MEFISDDYPHSYLHHRNVLNPYDSPYAHPDYLGGDDGFGQDDEPFCPDDEESGQKRAIMDEEDDDDNDDYISSSVYQTRHKDGEGVEEEEDKSTCNSKKTDQQWEEYSCGTGQNPQAKHNDDYNPKTDGKGGCTTLEEKLTYQLEQLKAVLSKKFNKFSEFCSWNCFFSLLFVVGVLLVFIDHYGSAYVRMMNMQKFFFFVMGVLTTTVAVVVVCVVVAFTSCYGDGF